MADRLWKGLDVFIPSLSPDSKNILISHQAPLAAMHYLLQHGNPSTYTKKSQDAFLRHIHSFHMKNGGFIEATYQGTSLTSVTEHKEFEPVKERTQNISFYASGILKSQTGIRSKRQKTASKNAVYHLTNGTDHLLKVLHAEDPAAVGRQVKLYEYLYEQKIAAPRVIFHDHSKAFYATDLFIQDYTEGVSQDNCFQKHPAQMSTVLKPIFTQLQRIHSLPTSEVSNFWIPPVFEQFRHWQPFMIYNINFTLHHLTELSFSTEAQKRITTALTSLKKYTRAQSFTVVPIHGDLAPDNIILNHHTDSCRFARIIDFEWARLGDRLWDYAYYWGWLERLHKPTALSWHNILTKHCTSEELGIIDQYRILFHAWTVRDMLEYKDDSLRLVRGEKSLQILS